MLGFATFSLMPKTFEDSGYKIALNVKIIASKRIVLDFLNLKMTAYSRGKIK
jgi:hypothetical protein